MTARRMVPHAMVLVLGVTVSSVALATPEIQNQFRTVCKLKADNSLLQCKSCHTTAPKLTQFGTDMKAEMAKQKTKSFTAAVWAKLGARDSNKNKVPNNKEVMAGKTP